MFVETISQKIPAKISEYIKKRFGDSFPFEAKIAENADEDIFYQVEIRQDELFYQLKFDKNGYLLEREIYRA